jgi:putative hemolysin
MTAYLRLRTYILQTRKAGVAAERPVAATAMHPAAIAAARDASLMAAEVAALPKEALLIDSGEYAIYATGAELIPHTLHEIGRLREITFRGVNEGTGKAIDLDSYDLDYQHLFCWHKGKKEIVGAYRIGQTDLILKKRGVDGLYTRTCFKYDAKLIEQMGPAIELGRSFVRPEYQKSYSPLLLLWKGIGQFVVRNPRYTVLFGPVSINNQYQSFSQQLIMTFLRATSASHLAGLIRAKNPPRIRPLRGRVVREYSTVVRDIDEVNDLVAEIEADRKGIPILLKQYMKLSARILGFNIDPDFGDVLDGLVLVDLRKTDRKLVEKFLTKEGAAVILDGVKTA